MIVRPGGWALRRVAAAAVAALVTAACTGGGSAAVDDGAGTTAITGASPAPSAVARWEVPDDGGTAALAGGVELEVPAGAAAAGTVVEATVGTPSGAGTDGATAAGEPVRLTVTGSFTTAVRLRFRVAAPAAGGVVLVARSDDAGSGRTPVAGTYDATAGLLTVETAAVAGWWQPLVWDAGAAVVAARSTLVDGVVPPALTCDGERPTLGYEVVAGERLATCVEVDAREARVSVANRGTDSVVLDVPAGWTTSSDDSGLTGVARATVLAPGGGALLPPGAVLELVGTLEPGAEVRVPVVVDRRALVFDATVVVGGVLAANAGAPPGPITELVRRPGDELRTLRARLACVVADPAWSAATGAAGALPPALAEAVWRCAAATSDDRTPVGPLAAAVPGAAPALAGALLAVEPDGSAGGEPLVVRRTTGAPPSRILPAPAGTSTGADGTEVRVGPAEPTGSFTVRVPVAATGPGAPAFEATCLVHADGYRAVPIATARTVDEPGRVEGTLELPVAVPGSWSLVFGCREGEPPVPLLRTSFDAVAVSDYSPDYYATVLSLSSDGTTATVRFVSHGLAVVDGELRDPATSCVVGPGGPFPVRAATYEREVAGTFYDGTLTFDLRTWFGMAFAYSCARDYPLVVDG